MKAEEVEKITLRRIYDSALLEFATKGYDFTTIDDIAQRAEVDKEVVVEKFGSKYEIFIEILEKICERYLKGQKNYKSGFELFSRSLKRIKEMAINDDPVLDFLINFSYSMDVLPKNCTERARNFVINTDVYKTLEKEMKDGVIKKADPFEIFKTFIRASTALTKIYRSSGLGLPNDSVYLEPFKEYFVSMMGSNKETAFVDNIEVTNLADEMIKEGNAGTFSIEILKNTAPRMFGNEKTLQLMGVENDNLSPEVLYHTWFDRIHPGSISQIMTELENIETRSGSAIMEYPWIRPNGKVSYFRAIGRPEKTSDGGIVVNGVIKDISDDHEAQIKVRQGQIYSDIAGALGRKLEIIFYIDVDSDKFLMYRPSRGASNYELEFDGSDFFNEVLRRTKKFIIPEDYAAFEHYVGKAHLLSHLEKEDTIPFTTQVEVHGHRAHVRIITSLSQDKSHFILSVENIDADVQKAEETRNKNATILRNVSSNFDYLTYVKLESDSKKSKDVPYNVSELFLNLMPQLIKKRYFSDKIALIIDTIVPEKERNNLIKQASYEEVIESLIYDDEVSIPFKAVIGGEETFYQIKFTADKKDKDIIGIIVSVGSIDRDIKVKNKIEELEFEQARIQSFNRLFADMYYSAYLLDFEENNFAIYKHHDEYAGGLIEFENYDDYFDDWVEEDVFEPDRDMVKAFLKTENIKEKLQTNDEFFLRYRDISLGRIEWFKLIIIKGDKENTVALGVVNIDKEVKKEQEEQKRLEELVNERTKELNEKNAELQATNEGIFEVLSETVEGRDKESGEHVKRVAAFTNILAKEVKKQLKEYNLSDVEIEKISLASKLHDIGKISVPDAILLKPGKLTKEEFEVMKKHTIEGAAILEKLTGIWKDDYLKTAIDICKYHHEKWDGKGYPEGLKGDDIPISAQIVSIADSFDALTNERVYKPAYTCEQAFEMIMTGQCGAHSEKLLKCFDAVKDKFFECSKDHTKYVKPILTTSVIKDNKLVVGSDARKTINESQGMSYETLERILRELPSNIFFKDTKGRYVFCSQIWKQIKTDGDGNFSIRGKTDLDIRLDRENAKRAFNEDRKIIKTGRPSQYVIASNIATDKTEYLELIKRPVKDEKGKIMGVVGQINDVTERVQMEEKLRKIAGTDELTGFGNRSRLDEYIKHTLPGVLYPVGVFMADCDRLKHVNDTFGHKAGDRFIKATAGILTTSFPDNSEFFRLGGDEFVIVVPGSDKADCQKYMEEIKAQSNLFVEDTRVSVSVGAAIMEWPDDNFETIVERADKLMYEEKKIKHAQQAVLEKKQALANKTGKKN